MSTNEGFEDVLRFWFSSLPHGDHAAMARQMEWWFRGGADSEIVERFPPLLDRAKRGDLDSWSHSPRSRLALIIVLDQFSRTLHRGTAQAFAQDPKALALALEGIETGHYAALETPGRKPSFSCPSATPRISQNWSRWSSSRRNSSKTRQKRCARCWNSPRTKLAAIAISSHASAVILTATKSWGGNQLPRNSTISQPANSSTPVRCQANRKLIIESPTEIRR